MRATEIVGFSYATFRFYDAFVGVKVLHREASRKHIFEMVVPCSHLNWQVSSIAQIVSSLGPVFSAVEHLHLLYQEHSQSSEVHNVVDRIQWRKLLRSFNNVKNLSIC
jgi:hypothetical protein